MNLPTLSDSRGRESTTLLFVALSWLAVTGKFIYGLFIESSAVEVGDYGAAVAMILAIWLGREWTEKK